MEESHLYHLKKHNDQRHTVYDVPVNQLSPSGSSKVALERFLPLWNEMITPDVLSGKSILIPIHGNKFNKAGIIYLKTMSEQSKRNRAFQFNKCNSLQCYLYEYHTKVETFV